MVMGVQGKLRALFAFMAVPIPIVLVLTDHAGGFIVCTLLTVLVLAIFTDATNLRGGITNCKHAFLTVNASVKVTVLTTTVLDKCASARYVLIAVIALDTLVVIESAHSALGTTSRADGIPTLILH